MRISFSDGRYVATSTYEEKDALKAARWRWDPELRKWWTSDEERASRLAQYADESCRARLADLAAARAESLAASRAVSSSAAIPCPEGLAYLPYQRAGIEYAMGRPDTLIGDEMGLGKTIQAIGVSNADPSVRRVLVLCPASLKLNWQREWRRWCTKGLRVEVVNGRGLPDADVLVLNYDILKKYRAELRARAWDLLIADEAHYLKNPKAQRTREVLGRWDSDPEKALTPIPARRRLFMSGTPILNRPIELWPLVHALEPHGLGRSWKGFVTRYCNGHQTQFGWDVSGAAHLDELQERLRATVMVRRLKQDVLKELPPKRRQVVVLPAEGDLEGLVSRESDGWSRQEAAMVRARAAVELSKAEGEEEYTRAVRGLREAAQAAFEEISRLRHELALAKLPQVIQYLADAEVPKVVVFCHHKDVVAAIHEAWGPRSVVVTGDVDIEDRQAAVDRFQTDPGCTMFIGTIDAAGVGLTLTAASYVVFAELDWTPGRLTQAEDRCHRIGQQDSVTIQHLVVDGSLDARMAQILVGKQAVIDAALDRVAQAPEPVVPVLPSGEPSTADLRRAQLDELAAALTPDQTEAIHAGLRTLAGLDLDRASAVNQVGFNKVDGEIGHSLASRERLTPRQAALGQKLLCKYRRTQLGALAGRIWPGEEVTCESR